MKDATLLNSKQEHSLLLLCGFNVVLLVFRMLATQSIFYGFLLWNLILAGIPYLVTWYLGENKKWAQNPRTLMAFTTLWLLFLPNAPYLMTDFLHFKHASNMPDWFDLLLLMAFACSGLMAAFLSMRHMQDFWLLHGPPQIVWCGMLGCCVLSGFGMYLGRFLRYNSWDLICHPFDLFTDVLPLLLERHSIGFSLGYGLFFFLTFNFFNRNAPLDDESNLI